MVLLGHGPRSNFNGGAGLRSGYIRGSGFVVFILLLYPICWACSEGANVISPTSEAVWYGVLDLLLGPVFLFYFLFALRNVNYETFGIHSWKYSDTEYGGGRASVAVAPGASTGPASHHHAKAAEAGVPVEALPRAGVNTAVTSQTAPPPPVTPTSNTIMAPTTAV